MASKGGSGHGRSAISGRYVKTSYANSHPKTTVIEHKTASKPSDKSGGKK